MSVGLIFNAIICFILGAGVSIGSDDDESEEGEKVQGDEGQAVNELEKEERVEDERIQDAGFNDDFDDRNRRARRALPGGFFGIHEWGSGSGSGDMSSDSFPTTFGRGAASRRPTARHERSMTMDERQSSSMETRADVVPPARARIRRQTQW